MVSVESSSCRAENTAQFTLQVPALVFVVTGVASHVVLKAASPLLLHPIALMYRVHVCT